MRPMNGKWVRILMLVMVLMLAMSSALASFDALVFSPQMKVYFGPSSTSEQIGLLNQGVCVTVEASDGDWARINYKGHVGFSKVEDLMAVTPIEAKTNHAASVCYITRDNLMPRWGRIARETTVYVRGMKGKMLLISNEDLTILAYIPAKYVEYK